METAKINGVTYTKEELIEIGKKHFKAARKLRIYSYIFFGMGLLLIALGLVTFFTAQNAPEEIKNSFAFFIETDKAIYVISGFIIAGAVALIFGLLTLLISFLKSDDMEYVKAGVEYLNKQ